MVNSQQSTQAGDAKGLFRRRVFGRGTIFLIVSLLVIGGWRLLHPSKVIVERQIETSTDINFKRKPGLSTLVSWSQDLNLSAAQEGALKKLFKEEQTELKPVEDEISKVTESFDQLSSKRASGPASLMELQAAARPISELSLAKRQIEQGFAERGLAILDATQKEKSRQLWEAKLSRRNERKKEVVNP
jgi:hypothetical protein